jgi:hypothetical protein
VVTPTVSAPTRPTREVPAEHEFFSGWKEIADYLRKGVRTVQRYERELQLPIHRPARKSGASVIASRTELDGWVTAALTRTRSSEQNRIAQQTNKVAADFLQIDSTTALTFSSIALSEQDDGRRQTATRIARRAYDSIMHLRKRIHLTEAEITQLDSKLDRLKCQLQTLDEIF